MKDRIAAEVMELANRAIYMVRNYGTARLVMDAPRLTELEWSSDQLTVRTSTTNDLDLEILYWDRSNYCVLQRMGSAGQVYINDDYISPALKVFRQLMVLDDLARA